MFKQLIFITQRVRSKSSILYSVGLTYALVSGVGVYKIQETIYFVISIKSHM